jgi:hypothetical protein
MTSEFSTKGADLCIISSPQTALGKDLVGMAERTFLIALCGKDGLSAALDLFRRGWSSIVLEKSVELTEIGADI